MGQDDTINTNSETEPRPESKSIAEQERDSTIQKLDDFFHMLSSGVSVVIERLSPSWCKGFLEEVPVTDEFGIQYLIDTWGGHLLSLKVRNQSGQLGGTHKVQLYTYPPLRFGRKLKPYDQGEKFEGDDDKPAASPAAPVVVNPPNSMEKIFTALPAIIPLVTKIMENSESRRQADFAMMMQMMKAGQGGGLSDISKIGTVMTQLGEIYKQNMGGGGGETNEMDFMGQALDVIKMFMDKPKPMIQMPQQAAPKLSPPAGIPTTPPPTPPQTQGSATVTQLPQNRDIARSISDMTPDKAAETIMDALSQMSPDKQQAAIGSFLGEYQNMMGDDQYFEGDEEGYEEEEDNRGVK